MDVLMKLSSYSVGFADERRAAAERVNLRSTVCFHL